MRKLQVILLLIIATVLVGCSEEGMKQYNKTDGIIAFHSYQSFKEGEVSADIAHEIGVKIAEEMWGDFEVVVATHQNTNHIHNHFIINSVSYKTAWR